MENPIFRSVLFPWTQPWLLILTVDNRSEISGATVSEDNHDKNGNDRTLVIPLDQRVLGEFIVGLLGQRRSIENEFRDRRFDINAEWLINLHETVVQRVSSQHTATLVSFSAKLYFAGGKVVTLEDVQSFTTYSDINSDTSIGLDLRWGFLIKFPLAEGPEKQQIRFAAFTDKRIVGSLYGRDALKKSLGFLASSEERLYNSVHFTNVTWGEDLNATVSNYVKSKTEEIKKWKLMLASIPPVFLPLVFSTAFMFGLFSSTKNTLSRLDFARQMLLAKYGDLATISSTLKSSDQKLDFIVMATSLPLQSGDSFAFAPFLKIMIWCMVVVCVFILASLREKSAISLNPFSLKENGKRHARAELLKYGLLLGIFVGTVSGVFAIPIYDFIAKLAGSLAPLLGT